VLGGGPGMTGRLAFDIAFLRGRPGEGVALALGGICWSEREDWSASLKGGYFS
jgi:hypothetical protein